MEDDSRLGYFVLGIGVGVAVGLLFAPKAGDETRRLIKDRATDSAEYLKKQSGELKGQASDLVDRSRDTISRHRDNLASAVEAGRSAYREKVTGAD
jgi:gas vesicle protein